MLKTAIRPAKMDKLSTKYVITKKLNIFGFVQYIYACKMLLIKLFIDGRNFILILYIQIISCDATKLKIMYIVIFVYVYILYLFGKQERPWPIARA